MAYSFDELAERERRRWMKPNAHLYMRPDAQRFMRPDAARFVHPDQMRFNPYGPEGEPEPVSYSARAYARPPAAIRAPAHAGRPRFVRASAPAPGVGPSDREILKLKSDLAALRVHLAVIRHENAIRKTRGLPPLTASDRGWQIILKNFARFQAACRKAGFDPNQPRVPAGSPDGGQWTGAEGDDGPTEPRPRAQRLRLAARRRSSGLEETCLFQYRQDTFICNAVQSLACWQQAALRYANCLAGLPIPPLVF